VQDLDNDNSFEGLSEIRRDWGRPSWLKDSIFYEIYPQSFCDSNGDGIGDIRGIIKRLDYIKDLGCNALWINPCFDSPFKDAGYDVRDYKSVAPRYGTNADLVDLFKAAHSKEMHVLLDLVPGHTSEEHEWFTASSRECEADRVVESGGGAVESVSDRYIWTNSAFEGAKDLIFIGGETPRDGTYILNFFKCQPALNYGFARCEAAWQQPVDAPGPRATRAALIDVMRFWLSQGCDGFRVDMADSLVKYDTLGKDYTIAAWREMLGEIKAEFPESAFVSEWGRPAESFAAGFDMDFYLSWRWGGKPNGYASLLRNVDNELSRDDDLSYFMSASGQSAARFLDDYLPQYEASVASGAGYWCFITGNHDVPRVAPRLNEAEIALAYGVLLLLPGVPFIYYGDEIGMRYRALPTKEGGYQRTGARTPMQWDASANFGFSTADAANLYLPVDSDPDAPTVENQSCRAESLYNFVRALLELRTSPASSAVFSPDAGFSAVAGGEGTRVLAFKRVARSVEYGAERGFTGESALVVVNPGLESESIELTEAAAEGLSGVVLLERGSVGYSEGRHVVELGPQSFAVIR
jgi:maltose alpha-D-glucosyltransferase/alpha-amylase